VACEEGAGGGSEQQLDVLSAVSAHRDIGGAFFAEGLFFRQPADPCICSSQPADSLSGGETRNFFFFCKWRAAIRPVWVLATVEHRESGTPLFFFFFIKFFLKDNMFNGWGASRDKIPSSTWWRGWFLLWCWQRSFSPRSGRIEMGEIVSPDCSRVAEEKSRQCHSVA
jgi:hypothetical protein